jgi:hypothetical protein
MGLFANSRPIPSDRPQYAGVHFIEAFLDPIFEDLTRCYFTKKKLIFAYYC